jgi:hypothetical protein
MKTTVDLGCLFKTLCLPPTSTMMNVRPRRGSPRMLSLLLSKLWTYMNLKGATILVKEASNVLLLLWPHTWQCDVSTWISSHSPELNSSQLTLVAICTSPTYTQGSVLHLFSVVTIVLKMSGNCFGKACHTTIATHFITTSYHGFSYCAQILERHN